MLSINTTSLNISVFRKFNVWYTIQDGNWSDPNTWLSNGKKIGNSVPRAGDTVYINHFVTSDVTQTVRDCYVSGTLKLISTAILTINGDLQATGTIDQTVGTSTFILKGYNNYIVNFLPGSSGGTIQYSGVLNQYIMPLTYYHLALTGGLLNKRIMSQALTINGNLYNNTVLDTQNFTLSVAGISTTSSPVLANRASSTIISAGNILFTGQVQNGGGLQFIIQGAASVEMRGGAAAAGLTWTNTNVTFTTNNQSVNDNFNWDLNNINITGAITITNTTGGIITLHGAINGSVAGSTFNNNGSFSFASTSISMATGVFNYNNASGSLIGFIANGSFNLPYSTYENLTVGGTGLKTLIGNTTVNAKLLVNGSGGNSTNGLDCFNYNLTVTNTTTVSGSCGLLKSGAGGTLIFIGQVICGGGGGIVTTTGNPTLEFRGGIANGAGVIQAGTGAVNFTTNNQSIDIGGGPSTWSGPVTIGAGLTITNTSAVSSFIIEGVLNGGSSTSIFINNGGLIYKNATAPMATGKLYCNQATNTFVYGLGNQDITPPTDPTPGYKNLTLNGTGVKRLLGNVSVKGTYILTSPATLDSNGFALTNP
jgi:hypothetical protein